MSRVSEWIVMEYFESLGYMVNQPCKYHATGRRKRPEEEVDIIVFNPLISKQRVPEHVLWSTTDLSEISCAVIGVYGWHTERFYPAMLDRIPELLRFMSMDSAQLANKRMGAREAAKILCLPHLPASKKLREEMLLTLKHKGIDGVLMFKNMLIDLMNLVKTNRNYEKSDLLQMIRILKNYDLLKERQMDLFPAEKRKSRKKQGHNT